MPLRDRCDDVDWQEVDVPDLLEVAAYHDMQ
jgi:hypothetical protein